MVTTQVKVRTHEGPRIIFGNWGAIVAAAFAGLGVSIVMMTLGMAIGITAGASADSTTNASEAARGFGAGMGLWVLISAIVVGIVAGRVLFRTSTLERPAMSALVTWALGLGLAALLAAISGGGLLAGLGGATSGAVQARSQVAGVDRTLDRPSTGAVDTDEATAVVVGPVPAHAVRPRSAASTKPRSSALPIRVEASIENVVVCGS